MTSSNKTVYFIKLLPEEDVESYYTLDGQLVSKKIAIEKRKRLLEVSKVIDDNDESVNCTFLEAYLRKKVFNWNLKSIKLVDDGRDSMTWRVVLGYQSATETIRTKLGTLLHFVTLRREQSEEEARFEELMGEFQLKETLDNYYAETKDGSAKGQKRATKPRYGAQSGSKKRKNADNDDDF